MLDVFLASRHGKLVVAVASLTIALLFLWARRATAKLLDDQKSIHDGIHRYVTVIRRDVLFVCGSAALMMSVIYLTCLLLDQ
ncbi:MAG: hypothetical protein JO065_15280 [Acidobacteria bacterium]|nr:hypothetical protein [Acidobacteriota bacterium]